MISKEFFIKSREDVNNMDQVLFDGVVYVNQDGVNEYIEELITDVHLELASTTLGKLSKNESNVDLLAKIDRLEKEAITLELELKSKDRFIHALSEAVNTQDDEIKHINNRSVEKVAMNNDGVVESKPLMTGDDMLTTVHWCLGVILTAVLAAAFIIHENVDITSLL